MGEDQSIRRRAAWWCAGVMVCSLLGCATRATPTPVAPRATAAPVGAAGPHPNSTRVPLVAVGLHDCEVNDNPDQHAQCQAAVYDPSSCDAAERALRAMDCCPRSLAGGESVSFQLIYCERRRPL